MKDEKEKALSSLALVFDAFEWYLHTRSEHIKFGAGMTVGRSDTEIKLAQAREEFLLRLKNHEKKFETLINHCIKLTQIISELSSGLYKKGGEFGGEKNDKKTK